MVKHLDHLNMSVRNVDELIDWYSRLFGFKVAERGIDRNAPWAILRGGEALLCIYEDPSRKSLDGDELRAQRLHGLNHFGLRVTDRVAFEGILAREHVEFSYTSPLRYPHSTSWYVRDPTGYQIEVACWDNDRVTFESVVTDAQ